MNKGALGLGVVVAGLAGYLFWDLQTEKKTTERKEQESLLFDFKVDQVNAFTLEKGGVKTRLTKGIDGWKIEEPIQDSADSSFTDDFLDRSIKDKYLNVAKEGEGIDWKVYGLDQPASSMTVFTQGGLSRKIEVSAQTNFEQNALARIAGENRVLVVPPSWQGNTTRGVTDFRDKRLLRGAIASVDRVELKNARGLIDVSLVEGQWVPTKSREMKLEQNRVREMLSQINETRAIAFPVFGAKATSTQKSQFGLDRPIVDLKIKIKDKDWTAQFGRGKDKADYASVSDPLMVLQLDNASIEKFEKMDLVSLRDKKLPFDFDKSQVQKIEVKTPIKKTALVKKNEKWDFPEKAENIEVNSDQVRDLVDRLRTAAVFTYADSSLAKNFQPKSSLRLTKEDGSLVYELSWGDPLRQKVEGLGGATVLARSSAHKDIFVLEPSILKLLQMTDLTKVTQAPAAAADGGEAKVEK